MSFAATDAPPPRRRQRWVWWTLGGCGTLVVLAIVAIVIVIVVILHSARTGGDCLPSGFPVDSGMTRVTSVQVGHTCTTAYRTSDSPSSVLTFYASALNSHGWQVLSRSGSTVQFDRGSKSGQVSVSTRRGRTRVAVVLRSG